MNEHPHSMNNNHIMRNGRAWSEKSNEYPKTFRMQLLTIFLDRVHCLRVLTSNGVVVVQHSFVQAAPRLRILPFRQHVFVSPVLANA